MIMKKVKELENACECYLGAAISSVKELMNLYTTFTPAMARYIQATTNESSL